jgi:hypothetical protein
MLLDFYLILLINVVVQELHYYCGLFYPQESNIFYGTLLFFKECDFVYEKAEVL